MTAPKRSLADFTSTASAKTTSMSTISTLDIMNMDSSSRSVSSAPLHRNVPTIAWSDIQLKTSAGNNSKQKKSSSSSQSSSAIDPTSFPSCTRGTIASPTHPLSGFEYHIKRHSLAAREAKLLSQLHHPKPHVNIVQVYAHGGGGGGQQQVQKVLPFLVIDAWEETLRKRLLRSTSSSSSSSKRLRNSYTQPYNQYSTVSSVLSEIGLPLTRVLKYLHSIRPHPISYNVLCLDSVAFLSTNTSRLVLMDFSKATINYHYQQQEQQQHIYNLTNNGAIDDDDDQAFDVWCLGKLLRDVLFLLKLLPPSNTKSPLVQLLDKCCHPKPDQRPTLLRIQKRLLEWKEPTTTTNGSGSGGKANSMRMDAANGNKKLRFWRAPIKTWKLPKKRGGGGGENHTTGKGGGGGSSSPSSPLCPRPRNNNTMASIDVSYRTTSTIKTDDETIASSVGVIGGGGGVSPC